MSWRYLKGNSSTALPRRFVFVDCETVPDPYPDDSGRFYHRFRLGVAIRCRYEGGKSTRREVFRFTDPADFWEWFGNLLDMKHSTWLIAHNLAYDLTCLRFPDLSFAGQVVADQPKRRRPKVDDDAESPLSQGFIVLSNPPMILSLRHVATHGRFMALDTLNYFMVPLAELGTACGLPKKRMPKFEEPDKVWSEYCLRDVEILERTMIGLVRFTADNDLGCLKWTASMMAMQSFRHRFMPRTERKRRVQNGSGEWVWRVDDVGKICYHDEKPVKHLERKCYHGGRVECFRFGQYKGRFYKVDVNGLYPAVMRVGKFPTKLTRWELRDEPLELRPTLDYARAVADVVIDCPYACYPLKTEKALLFPRGRFRTVLAGPELARAAELGHLAKIGSWAEYTTAGLFEQYVRYFAMMRIRFARNGNKLYERFCKMLLNSLYGKFGQLSPEWIARPDMDPAADDFQQWTNAKQHPHPGEFRTICRRHYQKVERTISDRSFPAISAFVTSYGRLHMLNLIRRAGPASCYYIGVDGLIVDEPGYWRLHNAGEIAQIVPGKLKLEATADKIEIRGVNDYIFGDDRRRSGQKRKSVESGSDDWGQLQFSGVAKWFDSRAESENFTQWIEKHKPPSYSKGIVSPSGIVEPFTLPDDYAKLKTLSMSDSGKMAITDSSRSANDNGPSLARPSTV